MCKKIIAILLAAKILTGCITVTTYAASVDSGIRIESTTYKKGTYEVNNKVLKIDSDDNSAARSYINDKSELEVKEDKIIASLTFNKKDLMSNIIIKVNGNQISYDEIAEGKTNLKVKFNLSSVNDQVEVSSTINTGFFKMDVAFRVLFDTSNLPLEENFETPSIDTTYKIGSYEIDNKVLKIDSDENSAARNYVNDKSDLEIKKDSITASLTFNNRNLMSNIIIKVNDEEVAYNSIEEGTSNLKTTFNLTSVNDKIEVSATINTGLFKMNVAFRVILDTSNLPKADEKPENNNNNNSNSNNSNNDSNDDTNKDNNLNNETPVTPPSTSSNSNADSNQSSNHTSAGTAVTIDKNKNHSIYKIKNEIVTNSAIGYSAARAAINNTSYIEKIDNDMYVTLGVSQLDVMSNIRVSVNGKKANYEIVRKSDDDHTMDIRFKINSLNDNIKMTAFINMTSMDISFGIDLLENTMELVSKSEASAPLAQKTTSAVVTNLASTSNNTSDSNNNSKSESKNELKTVEAKSYFKKYSIENEIVSNSAMGKKMTRKYVDTISILEDIDGKLYLTVKISDSNAMSNIRIQVNGKDADYSTSIDSDNKTCFKFAIGNINDDIKMYMTIKAINKDVSFGLKLLENSMKLLEEKQISQDEKNVIESKTTAASPIAAYSNNSNNISVIKIVLISVISTLMTIAAAAGTWLLIRKKKISKK